MGYKIGRMLEAGDGLLHELLEQLDFKSLGFFQRGQGPLPEHGLI